MDELSCGVGIRNEFDTSEIEFAEFFARNSPRLQSLPLRVDPVWCPLGHIIQEKVIPTIRASLMK